MRKTNCSEKQKCNVFFVNFKKIQMIVLSAFVALIFVGCSGGGSGSSTGVDSSVGGAPEIEGVFVDSPVGGINYMTETHTGITDAEGHFTCFDGEMITFMLGDVTLGQAMANDVITLMDFLDASEMPFDPTNPMVTNMGRFLQSLDADGDPENGITITEAVREEMIGRMVDFHQSIEDFQNDPDVVACFDVLNGLNMPHNGMMWDLLSTDQAQQHMIEHMGQYMGFDSSDGTTADINNPMNGYTAGDMNEIMNDHMGLGSSDGTTGDIENPMDGYTLEDMNEMMDDHMGLGSSDGTTGDIENPMDGYTLEDMNEMMDDHMGLGSSDGTTGDIENPMDGYTLEDMNEMMNDHMGFGTTGGSEGYSGGMMNGYVGGTMGNHM